MSANDGAITESKVNPAGGSGRDSWCTPLWLALLIGYVDLDPCSNERSHIDSGYALMLDYGGNGLYGSPGEFVCMDPDGTLGNYWADGTWVVFINPPYSRGAVMEWVEHWLHTHFIFLLRWDPSTWWFSTLIRECTHVWFPSRRINFEPPEGVESSSNPFPHALYMRDPSPDLLARLAPHGYTFRVDNDTVPPQSAPHAPKHLTTGIEGRISLGGTGGGEKGAGGSSGVGWDTDDSACLTCGQARCGCWTTGWVQKAAEEAWREARLCPGLGAPHEEAALVC